MLVGEPPARAAHAALHLVEHQKPPLPVAQRAQEAQPALVRDVDATFALDGFHQHGHHAGVACREVLQRRPFAVGHPREARQQRLESGLHLARTGGRQRRHGAPVEGPFHHHDDRLLDAAVVAVQPRELDGRFVGLAPGIAEEHPVHAGNPGEGVGEAFLLGDAVEVGGVDDARGLGGDGRHHARVPVPKPRDRDAGERVEVAPALGVPDPRALAAGDGHRQAAVGVHEVLHGAWRTSSKAKRRPTCRRVPNCCLIVPRRAADAGALAHHPGAAARGTTQPIDLMAAESRLL